MGRTAGWAAALLLGSTIGTANATHAVDSPGITAGERTITLNGHQDLDADDAIGDAGEHAFELGYAPNARWKTTLGWVWAQPPGGSLESAALAWENQFGLTTPGRAWADLGLIVTYGREFDGGADALEVALLAEKRVGVATVIVNLAAARPLEAGATTAFGGAVSVAVPVTDGVDVGVEYYGELGDWDDLGRLDERAQQFGPVVYGEVESGGGAFRYEGAVLFGLTGPSPDTTVRLQVEYAF
jgi:hypothetical protein